jgi:hypothetical protein
MGVKKIASVESIDVEVGLHGLNFFKLKTATISK